MSTTNVLSGLDLIKWQKDFITTTIRKSGFEPYMGDSENDIIRVENDLESDGYTVRIPLLGKLTSDGVSGNSPLAGTEEELDEYYQDVSWDFYRHAVAITKKNRLRAAVDLLAAVRPRLTDWAAEKIKYQLIANFHKLADGVTFSAGTTAQKNTFAANNSDRILFGATTANYSATFATGLNTIDNTADKLSTDIATLARFMARTANPQIKPFKSKKGREYYVLFCQPVGFRDVKQSTTMLNANRDARAREGDSMDDNPLFQDGDMIYDGVIFREIPEFYQPRTGTTANPDATFSNGTIVCGASFLCGAQAISFANKQAPMPTERKDDDYGFVKGLGTELAHGIEKLRWNNNTAGPNSGKDVGMVTVYHASVL